MAEENAQTEQTRKNVLSRLRKIEGQIRGIHNMVENGKKCEEVLIQVRAVKSALRSMTSLIVKTYLMSCYKDLNESASSEEAIQRLENTVSVLSKFIED